MTTEGIELSAHQSYIKQALQQHSKSVLMQSTKPDNQVRQSPTDFYRIILVMGIYNDDAFRATAIERLSRERLCLLIGVG